jgi:DNA-directed RNA polymerase specialized sigma subunit
MTVNEWIDAEYKNLSRFAKHWSKDHWSDLITHYYIYLLKEKNWLKISSMPHEEQMKFTQQWMKNSVAWKNSDFSKSLAVNNLEDNYVLREETETCMSIEIQGEDIDDSVKEWLIDLHENWGDKQIERLVRIRELYLSDRFTITDRIIYDMVYKNQMTMRQISTKINIPLTSVFLMIKELEQKMKEELCGTQSMK